MHTIAYGKLDHEPHVLMLPKYRVFARVEWVSYTAVDISLVSSETKIFLSFQKRECSWEIKAFIRRFSFSDKKIKFTFSSTGSEAKRSQVSRISHISKCENVRNVNFTNANVKQIKYDCERKTEKEWKPSKWHVLHFKLTPIYANLIIK